MAIQNTLLIIAAVERVHGRRMRGRRGGQMSAVDRVHGRRMRRRRVGQMYAVERVHGRRMRRRRTNVCSREGACEKDEGGGGEDKCPQ